MSADQSKFKVIGDGGLSSETLLEEFATHAEAINWAARYCRRDLGGYDTVDAGYYATDGEWISMLRVSSDDGRHAPNFRRS
jgi:hypothetical protein